MISYSIRSVKKWVIAPLPSLQKQLLVGDRKLTSKAQNRKIVVLSRDDKFLRFSPNNPSSSPICRRTTVTKVGMSVHRYYIYAQIYFAFILILFYKIEMGSKTITNFTALAKTTIFLFTLSISKWYKDLDNLPPSLLSSLYGSCDRGTYSIKKRHHIQLVGKTLV